MLTKDPKRRATIPELLAHPWLLPTPMSNAESSGAGLAGGGRVPDAVVMRLQQFSRLHKFKKQARKVLSQFLPEEEVVGLLRIFQVCRALVWEV
eukprot:350060-Chlamydomonas_euryale.AAC.3